MALLVAREIVKRFSGVVAVDSVSLRVHRGEFVSIIGPNGAGKTTLFNCLCGLTHPDSGVIEFDGKPANGLPPHRRAQLGIGRTFQTTQLFNELTLRENLEVAAQARYDWPVTDDFFGAGLRRSRVTREVATAVASFCGIRHLLNRYPDEVALREQRIAEVARALCLQPKLILLDEPASGMDPGETTAFAELLNQIRGRTGIAMLYIEHDMRMVMNVSDYIYVLDFGRLLAAGSPQQIAADPAVKAAYLGEPAANA